MSSFLSALWESILIPREVHALVKYQLTATTIDTSIEIIDAAELCSDIDYIYICLAKLSPSIAQLILSLTADVRDSICLYYVLSRTIDIISDDPDLGYEKQIEILQNFVQNIKTNPDWSLQGVGSTDNGRQLLHTFPKVISFANQLPKKYLTVIFKYIEKTIILQIQLLRQQQLQRTLQYQTIIDKNVQTHNNKNNNTHIDNQDNEHDYQENMINPPSRSFNVNENLTAKDPNITTDDKDLYNNIHNNSSYLNQNINTMPFTTNIKKFQFCIESIDDYNTYCTLTNGYLFQCYDELFQLSGLMLHRFEEFDSSPLALSVGLFIQKAAILRGYTRDLLQQRLLWPQEIWGQYTVDLDFFIKYPLHVRSRLCLNHMILDGLRHGLDAIKYLSILQHHQPTFTFIALQVIISFGIYSHLFNNNAELFNVNSHQFNFITVRPGLLCDLLLNCTNYPLAKGYIFQLLQQFEQKGGGLDTQVDPYYLNPIITRQEVRKAVAINQELKLNIMHCFDGCLGFHPIPSGWGGFFKVILITASFGLLFKYLTDYNVLWDSYDDEPSLYLDKEELRRLQRKRDRIRDGEGRGLSTQRIIEQTQKLAAQNHHVSKITQPTKEEESSVREDHIHYWESKNPGQKYTDLESTEKLLALLDQGYVPTDDELNLAISALEKNVNAEKMTKEEAGWELRTPGRSKLGQPTPFAPQVDEEIETLRSASEEDFLDMLKKKYL